MPLKWLFLKSMLIEFKNHIHHNFPFLEDRKLLIAISGGIDSVVLTHLCHQLKLDISLCHCNFKLRGQESEDDESFVKNLASELKIPVFTTSFETEKYAEKQKVSIQIAARDLRYEWFYKLLKEHQYEYVLTAHNTNDNLETFIINLTRGSGLEGFTGIPPINKKSVRPLLKFSRDHITMFAIKNGIVWREDRSNASIKYIRNKVRHKVLPVLQEINPHLLDSFQKTLENLNESQTIINDSIAKISSTILSYEDDLVKIDLKKLDTLEHKKAYLYEILNSYGFTEWNDVVNLIDAQPGKQVFSKTHRLLKDRNQLILTTINKDVLENNSFLIEKGVEKIIQPISLELEETELNKTANHHQIIIDNDLLNYPLSVRKWRYGDYICPVGMKGSKKLSQLFKDKKLSLIEKEKIWLLSDANDTIIWVIGMRQDNRFISTENTKNRLKISVI